MAYLPDEMPLPVTDEIDTKDWWEACQRKELVIQQCANCKTYRHPPIPVCYVCNSMDFTWTPVEGKGEVYTYTIAYHPVHPALQGRDPYNIVVVELTHLKPGTVRMVGNVVDAANEEVHCGMPVQLTWEERGGVALPNWKKA
jgi:hypothetical protein